MSVAFATAAAMGASLCADLGWYSVGRWRGNWALAALKRLSRGTSVLVDDVQRFFLAHERAFQLGARFLPELNPIAAFYIVDDVNRSPSDRHLIADQPSLEMSVTRRGR